MGALVSRYWWAILIRGIFAIFFGASVAGLPWETLRELGLLCGIWFFMDGFFAIITVVGGWQSIYRWFLLFEGMLGLGIGIILMQLSEITETLLLFSLWGWSASTGVLKILQAILLANEIKNEWWLSLSGISSLLFIFFFSFLLILYPANDAFTYLWLIAGYGISLGGFMMALSYELRGLAQQKSKIGSTTQSDIIAHKI